MSPDIKASCPNKKEGCGWVGEIAHIDDHLKECEISCSKCKQPVQFSSMKSHLDTECPCYCPYCDITAEREVISCEHKKCHKFPTACPNNIGLNGVPQDKLKKTNNINESQSEIIGKTNEVFNSSILIELREEISTVRKEITQSIQNAKASPEKNFNQKFNDAALLNQLCNIRSYLTITAVLTMAILIGLLLQSQQNIYRLEQQVVLIQETMLKR